MIHCMWRQMIIVVLGIQDLAHRNITQIIQAIYLLRLGHGFYHCRGHHGKEHPQQGNDHK